MLSCISRGEEWLRRETIQAECGYADFELNARVQAGRLRDIANAHFDGVRPNLHYRNCAGLDIKTAFMLLLDDCIERGIEVLAVDSLGVALNGDAEAARDVIGFFSEIEGRFRANGIELLLVDHMAKVREGERYQNKTVFGSVYKSNLVRSVIQLEKRQSDLGVALTFRHQKSNLGPEQKPFGVSVVWGENSTHITLDELSNDELAEEGQLNARDRVKMALADGPMFPDAIADSTGFEVKSVKNALTTLRKNGEVEDTGNRSTTNAKEVRLTVVIPSPHLRDGDDDDFSTKKVDNRRMTV
jgi:hypothetical protein